MHQPCTSAVWSTGVGTRARSHLQLRAPCMGAALHSGNPATESGCPKLPLEVAALTWEGFSKPKKHVNLPFLPEVDVVPL